MYFRSPYVNTKDSKCLVYHGPSTIALKPWGGKNKPFSSSVFISNLIWLSNSDMKSRRYTYKLGTSKVKKQIVSNYSLHIDNDSVVCSLLYFWSVCANTIASRRHGHFDLFKKKPKKTRAEIIQFAAYYYRSNLRGF